MEYSAQLVLQWIASYFWPYIRISSMIMVMAVFGARFVSARIRLYLGLAITFAALASIPAVPSSIPLFSVTGIMITIEQVIIGVTIGLITQFLMQTFVLFGQIIGMQSSLGFASMADPVNGQNTPVLGQLFMFLATLLFLGTDGHLWLLEMIIRSFETLPIGQDMLAPDAFKDLALWFGAMLKMALSMALSAVIALLTVNLSFGVMTRIAPQINIFSLGFAFALLTGLFLCWILVGALSEHYSNYWKQTTDEICHILKLRCH